MGQFHKYFLWRVTGFPCESLAEFALDPLARELQSLLEYCEVDGLPWRNTWERLQARPENTALASDFAKSFRKLRLKLGRMVELPRFQIAVAESSPGAAESLSRLSGMSLDARSSKQKRLELLGMRYLQRFVTKCETTSFFGPTATGMFGEVPLGVEYEYDTTSYRGIGFVGAHVLRSVINLLRQEPDILLRQLVRRRSGISVSGDREVVHPRLGVLILPSRLHSLLRALSTPILVADLVNEGPENLDNVRLLLELGLIADDLEMAWHARNPATYLREKAYVSSQIQPKVLELLDFLCSGTDIWPTADSRNKAHLVNNYRTVLERSGVSPQPKRGQFFADDLPFVEDGYCRGATLLMDQRWASSHLIKLECAIRKTLLEDEASIQSIHRKITRLSRLEAKGVVSLPEFLKVIEGSLGIKEVLSEFGTYMPTRIDRPIITSPDVMIAASDIAMLRRGDFQFVLSECHSSIGAAAFFVRVIPESKRWLDSISEFLASELAPLHPVIPTLEVWNKTCFQGPLHRAKYLEISLSAPPGTDTIELDDLCVELHGGVRVVLRSNNEPVVLLPGGSSVDGLLGIFRTPRFTPPGAETLGERIEWESVVVRRAAWKVVANDLPSTQGGPFETFAWVQNQRVKRKFPRWLFAHCSSERKPECIDLSNPFLCEELVRLLHTEQIIQLEEMLPSPAQAWVNNSDGHFLNELRLLYVSGGAH